MLAIELGPAAPSRALSESRLQPFFDEALADALDGGHTGVESGRDGGIGLPFIGEQEQMGAADLTCRSFAFLEERLQGSALLVGKIDNVDLGHGNLLWEKDYPREGPHNPCGRLLGVQLGIAPLFFLGELARVQGDHAAARSYFQEILAVARDLPKQRHGWGIADGLYGLGQVALNQGDVGTARSLFEKSLAIWRDLGDECAGDALQGLGDVARYQADYAAACSLYEEGLAFCRPDRRAGLLLSLAIVAQKQGNARRAAALCRESLALYQEVGEKPEIAACLEALGSVAGAQGQPGRAARLLGAAAAVRETVGAPLPPADRPENERSVAAAREALGEETFAAAWAAGRAMPLDEAIASALEADDAFSREG